MPETQSPCLSCHLKNYSKDNSTCKECDARCDYIKIIDGAPPTTLSEKVNKRASTAKLKQAEVYIQEYCEKRFISLEDLKSRRFSGGLRDARKEIAHTLRHKHVLSLKDIGKLLGKTQQAISVILKPKVIKPVKATFKTPPDAGVLVSVRHTTNKPNQTTEEPKPDSKLFIIIDFKDHADLYKHLIKTAKANFRKPEDHILYLINKEREGIDEYKEALQLDTG